MLLIMCPKCGNTMKCDPKGSQQELAKKKKKCVYCGHSIPVSNHILKRF